MLLNWGYLLAIPTFDLIALPHPWCWLTFSLLAFWDIFRRELSILTELFLLRGGFPPPIQCVRGFSLIFYISLYSCYLLHFLSPFRPLCSILSLDIWQKTSLTLLSTFLLLSSISYSIFLIFSSKCCDILSLISCSICSNSKHVCLSLLSSLGFGMTMLVSMSITLKILWVSGWRRV